MKGIDAKKFFWILVAVNVLLIGATFMVFTQASSIGQKKSQKIAEYKVKDQANDQLISYYKVLQNNLAANTDLEDVIQKVLPADKDQSAALVDLDKFAKNNNITIQQLTFNPGTAKGTQTLVSPSTISGVSVISVALSCSNTPYENLLNFLKTIETTQRRMQINSINISPNTTNPGLLDRVDMTLDIYLKAENNMQLFGMGKKEDSDDQSDENQKRKPAADLKQQIKHALKVGSRYETTLVALAVALLLAVTSIRMLRYMDPQVDDTKVQETLAKQKKVKIDSKVVDRIKKLQESGVVTPAPTKTESGRRNPFTED